MKELNQEQHIQLLQFMTLMQNCKTEEEIKELKEQYYNIPQYSFLQAYIPDRNENQSFSSYKTSLIYDMDKYQQDYKFIYGENFPSYKKETMPNNKADYTVLHLLNEINECDDIETYQKFLEEKNRFPKVNIEAISPDLTGIYFSNGLPSNLILNSPESNFNARRQLVEAGYSPFILPSVEDVQENGFDWLHEEITHFKELLNPNFIEQEKQIDQKPELKENEYEEEYDAFIEQMDANGGMSSMAAEADYNAFYEEQEDVDEVQRQMDMDNGLIDENGNEILYDVQEQDKEKPVEELSEEEFEKYIHSEEFISKFGDWEKASRLQKLSEAPSIIKNGKVIIEGEDVTDEVNNFRNDKDNKVLRIFAKNIGRSVKGTYHNDDLNIDVVLSMGNIDEIKNHHMAMSGHLEAIQYIPDIIKQGIYIAEEPNEDKTKHPNIEKYKYFVSALKIDGVDYTCKSAIGVDKDGKHYYDQRLSQIEKGLLLDNLSQLMSRGKSEQSLLNYDKRLLRICQCPQFLYLDKELKPTKEAVELVKAGKLYLEKDKNGFQLLFDLNKDKIIGKELSEMIEKNMLETVLLHIQGRDSSEQEEVLNPLISQENLNDYDKRLISICQVPQMPYLEKNITTGEWQPTKEAVEAVKNGTLFVEKQGQKYIMNESIDDKAEKKDLSETVDNESVNTDFSNNNIPEEYNETEQQTETHKQNYENNNSNVSAPRPRNIQERHNFFINNPYTSGTPVPTIAIRNEQTGHLTFIEGYDFARFEDVGKPNPAFRDENGKQIKPDGQTVVLSKPSLKEVLNEKTGKKEFVPDENNRLFVRISRDIYEHALKNSEIIAKRNPKTEQEKQKMIDDYLEAANLDEKRQRSNTASNFWHNYQAGVMTLANNKQEAMAFAKRLVNEMIPSEREKFVNMVRKYENIKGADGKHLSYDQRILNTYEEITKGVTITNKSIWRDHVNDKYNTLDAIKQNTEVFDKEGQSLDKTCRMKIGDTIKMSVTVDSALSNKKIKLPLQEYRLVAHSKDNNSVALISADGKQKIIKNREDFIKEVQKIEKKQLKKQQKQDRYESISM